MIQSVNTILTKIMLAFLFFSKILLLLLHRHTHNLLPIDFLKLWSRVAFFHTILLIPVSRFVLCLSFEGQISSFSINILELFSGN